MALEYKLSYTAEEIDEKLGLVGQNKDNIDVANENIEALAGSVNVVNGNIDEINENINTITGNINTINGNINTINGNVETLETAIASKADKDHTHDYADIDHTHNYAEVDHTHDNYAEVGHVHDYAEINHEHDNYASINHEHDYAEVDHNHDDKYDELGAADVALGEAKNYIDTKVENMATTNVVDSKVNTHNTATDAHNDIREVITALTNRLNALADSDDTTLDQMSELVDYIKDNRELIDSVTTTKVNVSDIVNNLTTNSTDKVLSAAQGVAIKALVDDLQADLDNHADNTTVHVTSTERTNWNAAKTHADAAHAPSNAEKNQNAFSNVKVGDTTVAADTTTDTLTLVAGNNVTITPDATNDKITISATDTVYTHPSTHAASMITGLATVATSGKYSDLSGTPTIPTKTSQLTNDSGFKTTDNNTTYSLSKSGSTITLTGSDGSTTSVTDSDTKYTHPTTSGNKHIPSGGSSGQILRWSADGTAVWGADNNTTYSAATTSAAGLMSASDKSKLDAITASADSVSFTQNLTSGTEVGTITINGTGTKLYAPTNSDTKNTAGSTNSSSKLFLVGATSQAANPQTYSHDTAYVGTDGCLYSNNTRVSTEKVSTSEPSGQVVGDYWICEY